MLELLTATLNKAGTQPPSNLPKDTGPGPKVLIGNNATAGFYGEVQVFNFISGNVLAAVIGLTAGTVINDSTPWLKFFIDNKIVFIPKLPIRYNLSWQDIYLSGAVYGDGTIGKYPSGANKLQNARINLSSGYTFIIRLMKGTNSDPFVGLVADEAAAGVGSEWNRLMYNICDSSAKKPSQVGDNWAHYTEAALGIGTAGNGIYSWTQENPTNISPSARNCRGSPNVTSILYGFATTAYSTTGWRPVLELVP